MNDIVIRRKDFKISNKKKLTIIGSVFKPENAIKEKCLLYLHSNAGSRLEMLPLVNHFSDLRINFVGFDFIGSGMSQGDFVTLGQEE